MPITDQEEEEEEGKGEREESHLLLLLLFLGALYFRQGERKGIEWENSVCGRDFSYLL